VNWKHVLSHLIAVAGVVAVACATLGAAAPTVHLPAAWTAYIATVGGLAAAVVAFAHEYVRQAPPPK
jgi:hypothetical protein